jgi:TonB family protein
MFFQDAERPRARHSLTGAVASLAAHLVMGVAALYFAQAGPSVPPKPVSQALTFVTTRTLPALSPPTPTVTMPAPAPNLTETPRVELRIPRPELALPPIADSRRVDVQQPAPRPRPRELPTFEAARSAPAPVVVGAFANSATPSRAPVAHRDVQTAAFDIAPARAPEVQGQASTATVGGFDRAGTTDPRPGSDRPTAAAVAEAGFGTPNAVPVPSPGAGTAGTVARVGFGNAGAKARPTEPKPTAQVQQTAFDGVAAAPAPARPAAPRPERIDIAVEVLSKPTPTYTNEARAMKLEGDVVLEVEFCASGTVRVLRVVRGLGHGLDESAARAAERIQFKPARTTSGPVDVRTTVQITFRLT